MSAKSNKNKMTSEEKRISRQRRTLQIIFAIFSIILIVSMVLSLVSN